MLRKRGAKSKKLQTGNFVKQCFATLLSATTIYCAKKSCVVLLLILLAYDSLKMILLINYKK